MIAASTLVAFLARDLYQMAMVLTSWHRYTVHFVNQALTLAILLSLLAAVILLEAYFRHGVEKGNLAGRVWRAASGIFIALAVIEGLRLLIEISAGAVNLVSVLYFVLAVLGGWGSRRQTQRLAGKPVTPIVFADAGKLTRTGWLGTALLLGGGALLLFLPIKFPLNPYDEGLALVNGLRVLRGDLPFRDYWAIYPPGQSYVLAGLFGFAGPTVMVERVYDTLVRLGIAVLIFGLALKLLPMRRWAVVPYVCSVVLLAAATFYGYAVFPALLFSFLSLLLWAHALDSDDDKRGVRRAWLFSAGVAVGLCGLFRVDIAVYSSAAILVGMALFDLWVRRGDDAHSDKLNRVGGSVILSTSEESGVATEILRSDQSDISPRSSNVSLGQRVTNLLVNLLIVAGGALLVLLPFYGWLAAASGFEVLWNNLITFPSTTFHEVRHLPYPPLWPDWSEWSAVGDWLRFYLPIVVFALTVLTVVVAGVRSRGQASRMTRRHALASALTVLGAGLFVQALSRYDAIHVLPASLCTILLLVWLLQQVPAARWRQPLIVAAICLALILPTWFYFFDPYNQLSEHVSAFAPRGCYSEAPAASCVPIIPEQETVLRLLNQLDPSGGPVFSGLLHHDQIFVNDVSLYFLAQRPVPTRYHELHPGVATTLPVQEEIIAELEQNNVRWLALVDWPNPREPNDSALSSGVTALDEYIRDNYTRSRTVGWYQLWQRQE